MATAYTVFTGRDALSFPIDCRRGRCRRSGPTADGLLVPVSEAAAEGEMSCEQAIALLVWLYENADLDVSGMCEADGSGPEHSGWGSAGACDQLDGEPVTGKNVCDQSSESLHDSALREKRVV